MVSPAPAYEEIRRRALELVETTRIDPVKDRDAARAVVTTSVDEYQRRAHLGDGRALHNPGEMVERVMRSVSELGPLTDLIARRDIEEIFIEGGRVAYLDGTGRLRGLDQPTSEIENRHVIDRLLSEGDRRLDAASPIVQARVLAGSARLTAVISPIADQLSATIRRYALRRESLQSLTELGSMSAPVASFLAVVARTNASYLVSGPPGSGKTSLLAALLQASPAGFCIRCCEEVRELHVPIIHGSYYEARPPALDGRGEISLRELVKVILAIFHFPHYFRRRESALFCQCCSHLLQDQSRRSWRGSRGGSSGEAVSESRCREEMARRGGVYRQRSLGVCRRPTTGIRGAHRGSRIRCGRCCLGCRPGPSDATSPGARGFHHPGRQARHRTRQRLGRV